MTDLQYRKSSPEESRRWGDYAARRRDAVCTGTPLRQGFRLALLPSFDVQRCWTVEHRPSRNGPSRAEHLVCEVADDYQRFLDADPMAQAALKPRIARTTFEIPRDVCEELDESLSSVAAPLSMTTMPFGTDGTSYLLERRAGFNRIVLEWWNTGPQNWREIAAAFQACWHTLDRIAGLPRQTP